MCIKSESLKVGPRHQYPLQDWVDSKVHQTVNEPGLMGRGINGTQRSLASQWSRGTHTGSKCKCRTESVCVLVTAGCGSKAQAGQPTPRRKLSYNKSLGGNKACSPIHHSSRTVLVQGQITDCGPDYSEVKAGPRTSWFSKCPWARTMHFLYYSPPLFPRSFVDPCGHNLKPVASPCTCNQNTEPRHLQHLCQQCAGWAVQTVIEEHAGDRGGDLGVGQALPTACTVGQVPWCREVFASISAKWPGMDVLPGGLANSNMVMILTTEQRLEASWVFWQWAWSDSAVIILLTQYHGKKENGNCLRRTDRREFKRGRLQNDFSEQFLIISQWSKTRPHKPPTSTIHLRLMFPEDANSKKRPQRMLEGMGNQYSFSGKWLGCMYQASLKMQSI